ncbi:hypothetical protein [Hylemonella gracilis]|uniref:Alginate export domain-containing protein n=1 Tax=Hylemonella gracilis ATCC 19624 TaxID=887062 RepID=F3KWX5_9BURK|nr:hypothetical protein [Hylemonella gracilis]EGI75762.1 hypothetical protein HGR_14819 [Hylemonella gracilis ATCC 19624]
MHKLFWLRPWARASFVGPPLLVAALLPWGLAAQGMEPLPDPLALGVEASATDERLGLKLEAWAQGMDLRREAGEAERLGRAVLDFRREWPVGDGERWVVSDRLEAVEYQGAADRMDGTRRNALRELYFSAQAMPSWYVDAGRINLRQGVGLGYNPSDYLRENAVVMRSSQNPAALRENRLGAVMVRAQWLHDEGSAQLAVLPQLSDADRFDDDTWALGLERTNRQGAALLRLSPRTGERLAVDFTAFARDGDAPQMGSNLSWTATDALLLQLEWSGGRRAPLPTVNAGTTAADERWFNRLAAGASWSSPWGPVLSLEQHYAGDALSEAEWSAWRTATRPAAGRLGALRQDLQERQDLLTRRYGFARLGWDRALDLANLDLSAFVRRNTADGSAFWQAEAVWHASERWDLGLQHTRSTGADDSEFGAAPVRATVALYLRCFL